MKRTSKEAKRAWKLVRPDDRLSNLIEEGSRSQHYEVKKLPAGEADRQAAKESAGVTPYQLL
jgi:hypothetical protein